MSKGNYIGGHTIIRDPAFAIKLARKLRKTRESEQRRAREKERFAGELAAYNESPPPSVLIKAISK